MRERLALSADEAYFAIASEQALSQFLKRLSKHRQRGNAGGLVSDPFADLGEASIRYDELRQALAVVRKMRPLDRFIPQSDINFFARIFETGDWVGLTRDMEKVLHPIKETAPSQAGELKRTLLTHPEARYSIKAIADAPGLHINTVRQRLTTLRQITGGWEDPVRALEMHMALRLEALFETPGERHV